MSEVGLYSVQVAVVGTATVHVQADTPEEAYAIAEAATTPFHVDEWAYVADEIRSFPHEQVGQVQMGLDLT